MIGLKTITLLLGMLSGLVFAPTFFLPLLFTLSYLCYQVKIAKSWQQAAIVSYIFGFGHFLVGMYWISLGVSVYIEEFWWAIPFALIGLPLILACFISASCIGSFFARDNKYYQFIFCLHWILFEWMRSWIFTGLPWNLLGYAFSFSDILIQVVSITGIYGLSFIVVYISTSFYPLLAKPKNEKDYKQLKILLINSAIMITIIAVYGKVRLDNHSTRFSAIQVRLIQPSIAQTSKWDASEFWKNLMLHIKLSEDSPADLIIWSEAALIVPFNQPEIKSELSKMLRYSKAILITGGVDSNEKQGDDFELYTSMYAVAKSGNKLFEYHKSHLVPFGEYMPLKNILPFKKLTHGFVDYTEGRSELVYLKKLNLKIKPLICYESIFPDLVRTSNKIADVIINITNDAWYGQSSGPYQHFQISRSRAVENGLPLIRVANNGISAVIDPLGRIIKKLDLNEVGYIDALIPQKINAPTIYSRYGNIGILIIIIFILLTNYLINLKFRG
ncbi:apolipoprotein N-acyltransferase [Rickettsia endosymbiont of Halotydeus destructor]|uniref:apolipoprotein N-acyltransferase n=1 Tax=Rickettsia endosymbiont of Halotydeus destructor TaxID=2996754 RepID=UPI003BAEDDE7